MITRENMEIFEPRAKSRLGQFGVRGRKERGWRDGDAEGRRRKNKGEKEKLKEYYISVWAPSEKISQTNLSLGDTSEVQKTIRENKQR